MERSIDRTSDGIEGIPAPDELVAFDRDEFTTAYIFAMNAVSGNAHIDDPTSIRFDLPDEDGEVLEVSFRDTPIVRIALALKDRYMPVSAAKYYSALFRVLALIELFEAGKLARWVRPVAGGGGQMEIHNNVIAAAAVVRFNRKGRFPVREFIRKVREIEAGAE